MGQGDQIRRHQAGVIYLWPICDWGEAEEQLSDEKVPSRTI